MPGFIVNNVGGNGRGVVPNAEYYYTYTWEIEDLFEEGNILGNASSLSNNSANALVHSKDLTLPHVSFGKETAMGASLEYKYAKNASWEDIKITWYDSVGLIDVIRRWRRRVWTPEGGFGAASDYKKRSIVSQYLPHRDQETEENTIRYRLHGSWPSLIRHGDLTYTSSDIKIVEVTITYDWAEEVL